MGNSLDHLFYVFRTFLFSKMRFDPIVVLEALWPNLRVINFFQNHAQYKLSANTLDIIVDEVPSEVQRDSFAN